MNATEQKIYLTPDAFSDLVITCDGKTLIGLDFMKANEPLPGPVKTPEVFRETERWLDLYFAGHDPGFLPEFRIDGMSEFRKSVMDILLKIPYGITRTYGEIAGEIAQIRGKRVSAQAVGGAVGRNPISIMIPCHRVIGADGSLTGYGGGIRNKIALLELEGIPVNEAESGVEEMREAYADEDLQ